MVLQKQLRRLLQNERLLTSNFKKTLDGVYPHPQQYFLQRWHEKCWSTPESVSAAISWKYDMRNTYCGEMRNTPQQLRVSPQQHFMPLGLLRTSYLLLPLNIESSYPALPTDNFTNTLSFLTFLFEVGKWLIYQSWGSWPHDFCPMTNKQKFVIWSSSVDYLFGS